MIKLLHTLFPFLHRYRKQRGLQLQDGIITPFRREVCRCGAERPLCAPVDTTEPLWSYDHTAGYIETPGGPAKFVNFNPEAGVVVVEHEWRHLVQYPAADCHITREECN